jgi:hypothetical protein
LGLANRDGVALVYFNRVLHDLPLGQNLGLEDLINSMGLWHCFNLLQGDDQGNDDGVCNVSNLSVDRHHFDSTVRAVPRSSKPAV